MINGTFTRYRQAEVANSTWIPTEVVLPDLTSITLYNLVPDTLYLFLVQSQSCGSATEPVDEQLSEQVAARTHSKFIYVYMLKYNVKCP